MTPTEPKCGERRPVMDIDGLGYADCIEPAGHRGGHRFGRTIHDDGSEGLNAIDASASERNEHMASIIPLNPVVPGHRLVIPKQHVESAVTDPERGW